MLKIFVHFRNAIRKSSRKPISCFTSQSTKATITCSVDSAISSPTVFRSTTCTQPATPVANTSSAAIAESVSSRDPPFLTMCSSTWRARGTCARYAVNGSKRRGPTLSTNCCSIRSTSVAYGATGASPTRQNWITTTTFARLSTRSPSIQKFSSRLRNSFATFATRISKVPQRSPFSFIKRNTKAEREYRVRIVIYCAETLACTGTTCWRTRTSVRSGAFSARRSSAPKVVWCSICWCTETYISIRASTAANGRRSWPLTSTMWISIRAKNRTRVRTAIVRLDSWVIWRSTGGRTWNLSRKLSRSRLLLTIWWT